MRLWMVLSCMLMCGGIAWSSPISFVDLFRTQAFTQTSGAPPAVGQYYFGTTVHSENAGDFLAGSVTPPGGSPLALTLSADQLSLSYGSPTFSTLSGFDAAFGLGTYNFLLTGPATNPDAPAALGVVQPADQFPGATPYVTNFSSLQNVDAAGNIVVNWNAYTGSLASPGESLVFFSVLRNSDGATVFSNSFLSAATTSTTIPADTLASGTAYTFALVFSNRVNGTNASGNSSFGPLFGFDLRTEGQFATAPTAGVPEPGTTTFMAFGMGLLAWWRKRRP